jgi:two-component system response regulator YesN
VILLYRLLIIDDEYLVRKGLVETIDWKDINVEVVGEAKNGREGLEMAQTLQPDIILLDMKMPIMDGLHFVQQYERDTAQVNIIVLSGHKDFDYARQTFEGGVFSYLLKPIQNKKLVEKVEEAIADLQAKRATKRFLHNIQEDLPAIYIKFMRDVFAGKIYNHDDIKERSETYGIRFPETGILLYGTIANDTDGRATTTAIHEFEQLVGETSCPVYTYRIGEDEFVAFFEACRSVEDIYDIGVQTIHQYETKHDETISIGISLPYRSITEIKYKYKEALDAANDDLYILMNHVSSYELKTEIKPQIRKALEYISKHYQESITVKKVAEAIYVSDSYLMHSFKDTIHMTFNEYVTEYRINKAKELLRQGHYRIYEVASMVGYSDVKYFSQVFRRKTNMTPSEYSNDTKK